MAGGRRRSLALAAIGAFVVVLGLWNAHSYPPGQGYDAVDHIAYADTLVPGGHLPHGTGEYYTPPGYYAVAGTLDWLAREAGAGEPHRAGAAINVFFLLGTALLVYRLARELWPGRERVALGAAAFVALVPVTVKTEAMFHPETLNLLLSTLALYLATRMVVRRSFGFLPALGVGVAVGADLLTRRAGLFTLAAILLALGFVALVERRPRALAAAAVVLVVGSGMYAPWYVHVHNLKPPAHHGPQNVPPPLTASFFTGLAVPAALATPWRPHFTNRVFPMTYTEVWGDFFGAFSWTPPPPPKASDERQLQAQSALGVVPTVLAVGGWLLLLGLALVRRRDLLPLALLPGIALVGYLWYTAHDLSPDGDVIKATYIVSTAPVWALGFAYAFALLPRRAALGLGALLAVSALVDLRFLVYGSPLGFL